MQHQKHFMQKEGKDGKPEGEIIAVDLNKWAHYRQQGYIFCEGTDAAQRYAEQESEKKNAATKKTGSKKKASKKK